MEFHIRPIEPGDARGMTDLRRMPGVMETTLGIPSQRVAWDEAYIAELPRSCHSFVAVAPREEGGLVIGCAGLNVCERPRIRHCGSLGIMVHRDYQGGGVGSALLEALLDLADNWLGLVRVELTVYTDHLPAIRLYEKYGFEVEGTKRMASLRAGAWADELLMARLRRP